VRVYLDVSCLNRPFDDQSQMRIRLEAEAVLLILERVDVGEYSQVSSEVAVLEIDAMRDVDRRARVRMLLPDQRDMLDLTPELYGRAAALQKLGFKAADALHIAAAEEAAADVFLSCDDRLCRLAKRRRSELRVQVANPLAWLKDQDHASNP